jgi:hypothetical protein
MRSRFAVSFSAILLLTVLSYAQEHVDVVIGSISDRYYTFACGADGRTFLKHDPVDLNSQNAQWSLLGVSQDGVIVKFEFPEQEMPETAAPDGSDLLVVSVDRHPHKVAPSGPLYDIFHFDNQANLLTRQRLDLGFHPQQMAVLSSGKAVIVGLQDATDQEDWKFVGAIVDADGQVLARFKFPLPPEGGGWTFESRRMQGGSDAAYMMLHSENPQATGLAKISEDGQIEIKIVPEPIYNDQRHHNSWMLGAGVAVEEYHYVGERSTQHYDEYDVNTGQRTASRYAFISGGSRLGCYGQSEVSNILQGTYVDPTGKLSLDTLRLVFAKLHDQAVSAPVVNPEACHCAARTDQH